MKAQAGSLPTRRTGVCAGLSRTGPPTTPRLWGTGGARGWACTAEFRGRQGVLHRQGKGAEEAQGGGVPAGLVA